MVFQLHLKKKSSTALFFKKRGFRAVLGGDSCCRKCHRSTAYCLFPAEDCIERKKWAFPLTVKAEDGPEAAFLDAL